MSLFPSASNSSASASAAPCALVGTCSSRRASPAYPTHTSPSAARTCRLPKSLPKAPKPPCAAAPFPAPPPPSPASSARIFSSHLRSTRSALRSSLSRSAGVCSCSDCTSARPCCARDAGVASRLSYAACAASGESPVAASIASATAAASSLPATAAPTPPQSPPAISSSFSATCATGKATSLGKSFGPSARAALHAAKSAARSSPPQDEAAPDKSASHKPRATAPSASRYLEKWSISRHTSCMSHGLAKSLYMSDSGRSSRSSSAANRPLRSASAPPRCARSENVACSLR
mmetsp:Transcript_13013/g.52436  ORF Transcript_13013/g.52436 Transcript_13013/m.52436 type:complete len:291 (-) Transcript_13013:1716-2588(-)